MMYPSIFGENLMDDVFDDVDRDMEREFNAMTKHNPLYGKNAKRLMKTDVRETDKTFEMSVDLPGIKKEDINLTLENGYLTIEAGKKMEKDTDKKGKLIRKERYTGSMERSFFVGEDITDEDITAKFDNGVLRLSIPKKEHKEEPEHTMIRIE